MNGLYFAPASGKASDLPIEGSVMLDPEMRTWAQARGMHLFYNNCWHVMIGKTWCTAGYEAPQKALEACWESGEYEDIAKCVAQQVAVPANKREPLSDAQLIDKIITRINEFHSTTPQGDTQ